jgi:hypothetical protein
MEPSMNSNDIRFARVFRNLTDSDLLDILFAMAERHPATFEELVMKDERTYFDVPGTDYKVSFNPAELTELRAFRRDQKISCIKRIRELTGVGLKEAKDLSEKHFGFDTPYDPVAYRTGYGSVL